MATIDELGEVLRRSKFDRYVQEEERLQFLAAFTHNIALVEVTHIVTECRDVKDNKFLELALSGEAICIISSDSDLLALHPFHGIPIITPHEFVNSTSGEEHHDGGHE